MMNTRTDIEIDLLRALVAVADTGGFTAAAESLHRTQSAVSQKIARLEETLGWKVFERHSRALRLTERGQKLLVSTRRMLEHYDRFLGELHVPGPVESLRLGVSENLTLTRLPALLAGFNERFPEVRLELTTAPSTDLLRDLNEHRLDVVIAKQRRGEPSQRGRVVLREPQVWIAASGYRENDHDEAQLILMRDPCAYRETMLDALDEAERSWKVACTVSNAAGVEAAVLGGLGVTVRGRSFLRPGMKVLRPSRRWPALPESEVAIFGDAPEVQPMVQALITMLGETQEFHTVRAA
jgi:DNA-binding transcriptional LysR family regulator